jgi:site-specific DNA-methyltransferase (adenine-specific)
MSKTPPKVNNRSVKISPSEIIGYSQNFLKLDSHAELSEIVDQIINQDTFEALDLLPSNFVDLLFVDPPYNMSKTFNSNKFAKRSIDEYSEWLDNLFVKLFRLLKPTASVYFCGDWFSSTSIHIILDKYLKVHNRITWEREKGRGAKFNWKNSSEDIWFGTVSDEYYYDVDAVKLKRRVMAPYKENGSPKDWEKQNNGSFRLTHPSNIWTDITVPFWSMSENTEHPTQKPEKLLAKIILASSKEGDIVFDPFLGSGTTAVVAKKLSRKFVGIELDTKFASIASKRLELVEKDKNIQGYTDGVFWERNSLIHQTKKKK